MNHSFVSLAARAEAAAGANAIPLRTVSIAFYGLFAAMIEIFGGEDLGTDLTEAQARTLATALGAEHLKRGPMAINCTTVDGIDIKIFCAPEVETQGGAA